MKSIKYNKLIRDRIPEIIEKSGKKAIVETLNESDYINFLKAKLEEELEEFKKKRRYWRNSWYYRSTVCYRRI